MTEYMRAIIYAMSDNMHEIDPKMLCQNYHNFKSMPKRHVAPSMLHDVKNGNDYVVKTIYDSLFRQDPLIYNFEGTFPTLHNKRKRSDYLIRANELVARTTRTLHSVDGRSGSC